MTIPRKPNPRVCSVDNAMEILGTKWVTVIVREMLLNESARFDEIVHNTGVPRDVLARRLRLLEDAGLVIRRQYLAHPPRYDYLLTEPGRALHPVLQTIRGWGDAYATAPENVVDHTHTCGAVLRPRVVCTDCGVELTAGDSRATRELRMADIAKT